MTQLWDAVIGQEHAVEQLRAAAVAPVHAYLFIGPPGTGKRTAARAFAAALLCPDGGCGECSHCIRVAAANHPDLALIERRGASLLMPQIRDVVTEAHRSPTERPRKVLVLEDVHLIEDRAPALLKTVEEPPASTIFVLLADRFPPELVTIASRCVTVEFGPVPAAAIVTTLVAEGASETVASDVAAAADGSIDLARLLARDPSALQRRGVWREIPRRLDGRGATIAAIVDEVRAGVDAILEPLTERQAVERAAIEAQAAAYNLRGVSAADEDRWKREQRRVRTDELRAGLRTLIAAYREQLGSAPEAARAHLEAIDAIQEAGEALVRNPNEQLLLQGLLARLSTPLRSG